MSTRWPWALSFVRRPSSTVSLPLSVIIELRSNEIQNNFLLADQSPLSLCPKWNVKWNWNAKWNVEWNAEWCAGWNKELNKEWSAEWNVADQYTTWNTRYKCYECYKYDKQAFWLLHTVWINVLDLPGIWTKLQPYFGFAASKPANGRGNKRPLLSSDSLGSGLPYWYRFLASGEPPSRIFSIS